MPPNLRAGPPKEASAFLLGSIGWAGLCTDCTPLFILAFFLKKSSDVSCCYLTGTLYPFLHPQELTSEAPSNHSSGRVNRSSRGMFCSSANALWIQLDMGVSENRGASLI